MTAWGKRKPNSQKKSWWTSAEMCWKLAKIISRVQVFQVELEGPNSAVTPRNVPQGWVTSEFKLGAETHFLEWFPFWLLDMISHCHKITRIQIINIDILTQIRIHPWGKKQDYLVLVCHNINCFFKAKVRADKFGFVGENLSQSPPRTSTSTAVRHQPDSSCDAVDQAPFRGPSNFYIWDVIVVNHCDLVNHRCSICSLCRAEQNAMNEAKSIIIIIKLLFNSLWFYIINFGMKNTHQNQKMILEINGLLFAPCPGPSHHADSPPAAAASDAGLVEERCCTFLST